MQVFAIFDVSHPTPIKANLDEKYPDDYYQSGERTFFVATVGKTTRQIAQEMGVAAPESGVWGIVIPVSSYWGVHSANLWEWLNVKMSQNGK